MRKLLLPVLTGFWLSGAAQQSQHSLLSSGGGHATTEFYSIDWSLGELAVETAKASTDMYTQGFLQPLVMRRSPGARLIASSIYVTVYPNPTHGRVVLSFEVGSAELLTARLYNTVGTAVLQSIIPKGSNWFTLNTATLPQGSYLLSVGNKDNTRSENFTIIKLH